MSTLRNVAVVLAGGTGSRVGLSIPKQLIKIAGKPIIEHTIATMNASPLIDEIIVMMAPGHLDPVRSVVSNGGYDKVTQILEGAETRNGTTSKALDALGEEECNVLLHDAVRPWSRRRSSRSASPRSPTTRRSTPRSPRPTPSSRSMRGPVPSPTSCRVTCCAAARRRKAFRLSVIRKAYQNAAKDPDFVATDDCTVVLRYLPEVPIAVVNGHERNMKVTEPIDIYIADKLFQLTSADRPASLSDEEYREALEGQDRGRLRRVVRHRRRHRRPRREARRDGPPFSRSLDQAPTSSGAVTWPRLPSRCSPRADGSTSSSTPPACCRAASCPRPARRRSTTPPRSTTSPRSSSPRSSTPTSPRPVGRCCCSRRRRTRGGAAATRCTPRPRPPSST
ncbi:MAG: 2-C-methyl-D-erythritol 4-phosphate cytidylyltransferase [Nocardioidaceae bacterium]